LIYLKTTTTPKLVLLITNISAIAKALARDQSLSILTVRGNAIVVNDPDVSNAAKAKRMSGTHQPSRLQ